MRAWSFLLVPLLASAAVYHPITRAYFFADDFVALFALSNGTGSEWVTSSVGGHLYVVRNLVMALLWSIAGVDPRAYFWVGLLAHLAVVAGLFAVVFGSTGRALLAAIVATLWGTCPMSVGTLSWIAAHGHAFAALAFVLALAGMLARSRRDEPVGAWLVLGWGGA